MLQRIKGNNKSEQIKGYVKTAREMVSRYGWEDREITPWGYTEKITKVINDIADYDKCTQSSKGILVQLANGLAEVMNYWERREQ